MGLLKKAFKWMGYSSEWVIQVNGSFVNGLFKWMAHLSELVIWVNGSFEWMGHSSEWEICKWVIRVNGSFKAIGHSSEWVIWVNGSFKRMGLLKGASEWMGVGEASDVLYHLRDNLLKTSLKTQGLCFGSTVKIGGVWFYKKLLPLPQPHAWKRKWSWSRDG